MRKCEEEEEDRDTVVWQTKNETNKRRLSNSTGKPGRLKKVELA